MAKLTQYFLRYVNTYQPDLFQNDPEIGCKHEWPIRQKVLGRYLETDDSIVFKPVDDKVDRKTGEVKIGTTYPHRVWHSALNPDIVVMRFANVKDMIIEKDFEEKHIEHNPSLYVIWDNRDNCRRIAIQKHRDSFSSTNMVAEIIQDVFNKVLEQDKHEFQIELKAQRYSKDFYRLWETQKNVAGTLRFNVSDSIVRDGNEVDYLLSIEEMSRENDIRTTLELKPKVEGEVLRLNVSSDYVKKLVHASAGSASTIELVTIDGAVFECFINTDLEFDDKIIAHEIDIEVLDALFSKDEDKVANADQKLIEFCNMMKKEAEDEEGPKI